MLEQPFTAGLTLQQRYVTLGHCGLLYPHCFLLSTLLEMPLLLLHLPAPRRVSGMLTLLCCDA